MGSGLGAGCSELECWPRSPRCCCLPPWPLLFVCTGRQDGGELGPACGWMRRVHTDGRWRKCQDSTGRTGTDTEEWAAGRGGGAPAAECGVGRKAGREAAHQACPAPFMPGTPASRVLGALPAGSSCPHWKDTKAHWGVRRRTQDVTGRFRGLFHATCQRHRVHGRCPSLLMPADSGPFGMASVTQGCQF